MIANILIRMFNGGEMTKQEELIPRTPEAEEVHKEFSKRCEVELKRKEIRDKVARDKVAREIITILRRHYGVDGYKALDDILSISEIKKGLLLYEAAQKNELFCPRCTRYIKEE